MKEVPLVGGVSVREKKSADPRLDNSGLKRNLIWEHRKWSRIRGTRTPFTFHRSGAPKDIVSFTLENLGMEVFYLGK